MTGRDQARRGLRWGWWLVGGLGVGWGLTLPSRGALAFGVAQWVTSAVCWAYARWSGRGVEVERVCAEAACEDDALEVRFELRHRGWWPLCGPWVEDSFPPDKTPNRRGVLYPGLRGRRRAEVGYLGRCAAKRGVYPVGPARLRVTCPLGVYEARRSLGAAGRVTVYPAVQELPSVSVEAGTTSAPRFGGQPLREAGEGEGVLGVREHRPGDGLARIHWPTSARRGRLAILEYEREVARRVTIVLDLARDGLRGLGRQSNVEVGVQLTASLAAQFVQRGDWVGLEARGREPVRVLPGRGTPQLERILRELALVAPEGEVRLPEVLEDAWVRVKSGQSVVVLVGDPGGDVEGLERVFAGLRARGCAVVAVVCDPLGFRRIFGAQRNETEVAAEVAGRLQAAGARVYVVHEPRAVTEGLMVPWTGRRRVRVALEGSR